MRNSKNGIVLGGKELKLSEIGQKLYRYEYVFCLLGLTYDTKIRL